MKKVKKMAIGGMGTSPMVKSASQALQSAGINVNVPTGQRGFSSTPTMGGVGPKPSTPLPAPKVPPKPTMGGINPNVKLPAGIDLEKIRQGVQSLPKAQQGDDFVSKQQSNVPFSQRVQGLQQLGQNKAAMMKKGGEAKKYTKGGKINLDACGVSTAQKSKSSPKW